jgi:hypothetical protein
MVAVHYGHTYSETVFRVESAVEFSVKIRQKPSVCEDAVHVKEKGFYFLESFFHAL